jgi:hypothetical protein
MLDVAAGVILLSGRLGDATYHSPHAPKAGHPASFPRRMTNSPLLVGDTSSL